MSTVEPILNITPVITYDPNYVREVNIPASQRGYHQDAFRWIKLPAGIHTVIVDSTLPFPLMMRSSDNGSATEFQVRGTIPANPGGPKMFTIVVASDLGGYLTVHPTSLQSEETINALTTKAFGVRVILGEARGSGGAS